MNLNNQAQRSSILRTNQPPGERQKKRASFSDDVMNQDQMRRASGLSIPASENTTDDSNKSNETFDFWPRTSSFPGNAKNRIGGGGAGAERMKITTGKLAASDSTISSRSASQTACFPVNEMGVIRMRRLINSDIWKVFIFSLTLIMVFGSTLQLFFPVEADPIFDIIFTITLVLLTVDIVMMCYTTPMYFVFRPSMKLKKGSDEIGCLCFSFQIGSFNFWFDVISVVSLLFDISFINSNGKDEIRQVHIGVNSVGSPLIDTGVIRNPLSVNGTIISIILRTARVARLLRVDIVTVLQNWTGNLNRCLCRRNGIKNSVSLRKFFKYSQNDAISEKRFEEMHEAATKIQRAWRSQNTMDVVRAFQLAGQSYANKSQRSLVHSIRHNSSSFRHSKSKVEEDFAERKNTRQISRLSIRNSKAPSEIVKERRVEYKAQTLRFMQKKRGSVESSSSKKEKRKKKKSQIGSAMNEMTMRRVAVGMMIAITLTALFTYAESNIARELTVLSMHRTMLSMYKQNSINFMDPGEILNFLDLQTKSSTPDMVYYLFHTKDGNINRTFPDVYVDGVRQFEKLIIDICTVDTQDHLCTLGSRAMFVDRRLDYRIAWISLVFIFFLLFVWIAGLLFFVGPVTTLVVYPIERMIRLLSMLVKDPLGYSKTKKYRQFIKEDDELALNTTWTQESLNGMETSFLMSTILRIGSLMKVGFGSAGVEIIRSNLQKSTRQSISLTGSSKKFDSTVACIFMFCDIRGFTDSSECLNEEVFVFTNRIAAVVHSYCHAYGGSANKNIGDAFLLSWQLDNPPAHHPSELFASKRQADKALLSVVKICIALYYESFFLEGLSQTSIDALKRKFATRPGNLVQLGFGLHAGKAVEGAIGSQRKLDATYLSEAVELAEFLESSTKKYGVTVLMSGKFYSLLHSNVKGMCRKIDHIFFTEEYEENDPSGLDETNDEYHMSLHTFDMDIDALFKKADKPTRRERSQSELSSSGSSFRKGSFKDDKLRNSGTNLSGSFLTFRRMSNMMGHRSIEALQSRLYADESVKASLSEEEPENKVKKKLEIPDGTLMYSHKVWHVNELRTIRKRFTPAFYEKFNAGYHSYIRSDWSRAKKDFEYMVSVYNDKPSQVFLDKMHELKNKPPQNFRWRYDTVSMEYH